MNHVQKKMQELISMEEIQKAFDARFPKEIQEKLRNAKVAIAGLGGLGSNIAFMLARCGVGKLLLVDFDVVDVTNLNRQMYMVEHLGREKAEALPELLYHVNPYLNYQSKCVKVTSENVEEIFGTYEYVCEAFDKPDQKAMLVREILSRCPNTTIVSGNGMAGFGDTNDIKTTRKLSRLYVCGDYKTDVADGIGLMSPRVTACAAHQANKIIQLILES